MSDLNRRLGPSHMTTRANTVEKKIPYALNSRIHGYHKSGSYCSVSSVICGPTKSGILKLGPRTHLMDSALPKQLCFKFYVIDNCTLLKKFLKTAKTKANECKF